jgi:hypothetical protein
VSHLIVALLSNLLSRTGNDRNAFWPYVLPSRLLKNDRLPQFNSVLAVPWNESLLLLSLQQLPYKLQQSNYIHIITGTMYSRKQPALLAASPLATEDVSYNAMYYLKGAAAGGICCSITHGALTPVDVVKTRVQLDSAKVNYKQVCVCVFVKSFEREGTVMHVSDVYAVYVCVGLFSMFYLEQIL